MNISGHLQQGREQPHIGLLNIRPVLQHHLTEEMALHWKEGSRVKCQNLYLQNRPMQQRSFAKPAISNRRHLETTLILEQNIIINSSSGSTKRAWPCSKELLISVSAWERTLFLTAKPTFGLDLLSAIKVQQSSRASAVMCKSESLTQAKNESHHSE